MSMLVVVGVVVEFCMGSAVKKVGGSRYGLVNVLVWVFCMVVYTCCDVYGMSMWCMLRWFIVLIMVFCIVGIEPIVFDLLMFLVFSGFRCVGVLVFDVVVDDRLRLF